MATPKTVLLKGSPVRKEGIASEAITPGHLIEFGGTADLRKHATAGGNGRNAFAIEPRYIGQEIDTAYAQGDQVEYVVASSGDEIYAFLDAGETATKGAPLESAGNGALQVHVAPSQAVDEGGAAEFTITQRVDAIKAYALEAKDNSGGGAAVRIRVEVA